MKRVIYLLGGVVVAMTGNAWADAPVPWQMDFQEAASPVMHVLTNFHHILLGIIFSIAALVLGLLVYVCLRFHESRNPKPSRTSHNTLLEIAWTTIPVIILVVIAVPSLKSIYFVNKNEETAMTLKVIGYQWYWGYQYPDQGDISFDSYIVQDDELKPGDKRLLTVDNPVVLPVGKKIKILVTGADVIHSWAIPSLGFKIDAVPGRLNEGWIEIEKPGVYYGQCSELCGVKHGFMPIQIKAVPEDQFQDWVEKAKQKFSYKASHSTQIAVLQQNAQQE